MLVYIAAPLGDPDPAVRAWHRERANLLAALAFAIGHIPVCVHTYAELAIGSDTDPDARERGLKRSMDALDAVFRGGGQMWVLLHDTFTASHGVTAEINRWDRMWGDGGAGGGDGKRRVWGEWRELVQGHAPHLLPEFDRLAVRP